MDREFVGEYFDLRHAHIPEELKGNKEFEKLQYDADQKLEEIRSSLPADIADDLIDAYMYAAVERESYLLKAAYLYGADDRERMLKV